MGHGVQAMNASVSAACPPDESCVTNCPPAAPCSSQRQILGARPVRCGPNIVVKRVADGWQLSLPSWEARRLSDGRGFCLPDHWVIVGDGGSDFAHVPLMVQMVTLEQELFRHLSGLSTGRAFRLLGGHPADRRTLARHPSFLKFQNFQLTRVWWRALLPPPLTATLQASGPGYRETLWIRVSMMYCSPRAR